MAQDHGLCRKKGKESKWNRHTGRHCRPVLQLPTGQSCSLQTCWSQNDDDPGAHGNDRGKHNELNGAKQLDGGKLLRAVGMAGKVGTAGKTQPAEQALQANTAGGLSARHKPQNKQPADGRPCSKQQQPQTMSASLSPCSAGKWGSAGVLAAMRAGADLPTLSLPHLSPLPVTVPTHSLNL